MRPTISSVTTWMLAAIPVRFLLERGDWEGAAALLEPGDDPWTPPRLHKAMVLAKREAEAAKFADSWTASHPKDAVFVFYLGDAALARGDLASARGYAERALFELSELLGMATLDSDTRFRKLRLRRRSCESRL